MGLGGRGRMFILLCDFPKVTKTNKEVEINPFLLDFDSGFGENHEFTVRFERVSRKDSPNLNFSSGFP